MGKLLRLKVKAARELVLPGLLLLLRSYYCSDLLLAFKLLLL